MQAPKEHLIFELLNALKESSEPAIKSRIYELIFIQPECLYAIDSFGNTPLRHAVKNNWIEAAELLIAQAHSMKKYGTYLNPVVLKAIEQKNINIVTRLLQKDFPFDLKISLLIVIKDGNMEMLQLLLEKGNFNLNEKEILEVFEHAFSCDQSNMIKMILQYNPQILAELIKNHSPAASELIKKIIPLTPQTCKYPDLLKIAIEANQWESFKDIATHQGVPPLLRIRALEYAIDAWHNLNEKLSNSDKVDTRLKLLSCITKINTRLLSRIIKNLLKQGTPVCMKLYKDAINKNDKDIITLLSKYDVNFPYYKNILFSCTEFKPEIMKIFIDIGVPYTDDILDENKVKAYIREHGEVGMYKIAPQLLEYKPGDSHQIKNQKLQFFGKYIANEVTNTMIINCMIHWIAKDSTLFSKEILVNRNILMDKLVEKAPRALLTQMDNQTLLYHGICNKDSFLLTLFQKYKKQFSEEEITTLILETNKSISVLKDAAENGLWDYCNFIMLAFQKCLTEELVKTLKYGTSLNIFVEKNHLLCAEIMLDSSVIIEEAKFHALMLKAIKNKFPAMVNLLLFKNQTGSKPLSSEILEAAQADPECLQVLQTAKSYESFGIFCRRLRENIDKLKYIFWTSREAEKSFRDALENCAVIAQRVKKLPDAPDMPDFTHIQQHRYQIKDIQLDDKADPYDLIKNYKLLFDHALGIYDWLVEMRDYIKVNEKNWFTTTMTSQLTSIFQGESHIPGKSKTLCEIESKLNTLKYNSSVFDVLKVYYDVSNVFLNIEEDTKRHHFTTQFFKTNKATLLNHIFPIKIVEGLEKKRKAECEMQMQLKWRALRNDWVELDADEVIQKSTKNPDSLYDEGGFYGL